MTSCGCTGSRVGMDQGDEVGGALGDAGGLHQNRFMATFDDVWTRIERHAGQTFTTATGLPFTYRVPGDYLRVFRDGREINRSLSRTNFKAAAAMPQPSRATLRKARVRRIPGQS